MQLLSNTGIKQTKISGMVDSFSGISHHRSSEYVSDLAKINGCPVIHVNADNPEVRLVELRM